MKGLEEIDIDCLLKEFDDESKGLLVKYQVLACFHKLAAERASPTKTDRLSNLLKPTLCQIQYMADLEKKKTEIDPETDIWWYAVIKTLYSYM